MHAAWTQANANEHPGSQQTKERTWSGSLASLMEGERGILAKARVLSLSNRPPMPLGVACGDTHTHAYSKSLGSSIKADMLYRPST